MENMDNSLNETPKMKLSLNSDLIPMRRLSMKVPDFEAVGYCMNFRPC